MEKGYSVEYGSFCKGDNCIILDNNNETNEVYTLAVPFENIELFKDKYTIGVWKIKKLN